jgi:hypothetical protein
MARLKLNRTKIGKRMQLLVGGTVAVVALTLSGALPAEAATYVGYIETNDFAALPKDYTTSFDGYCAVFSIHNDKGYDFSSSCVNVRHVSITTSGHVYEGSYAAPGSWSYDSLDYANVVLVGDYAYV